MPKTTISDVESLDKRLSGKEFMDISKWVFKYVYSIDPKRTRIVVITKIIFSFRTLLDTYIFAKLLDSLIAATTTPNASLKDIIPYLAIMFVFNIFFVAWGFVNSYTRNSLRNTYNVYSKKHLAEHINKLGIQSLENPTISNSIFRANDTLQNVFGYFISILDFISYTLMSIGALLAVVTFSPIMAIILVVSTVPAILNDKKYRYLLYKHSYDNTENNRISRNIHKNLTSSKMLPEINLNSSFTFLMDKYLKQAVYFLKENMRITKLWHSSNYFYTNISELVLYSSYLVLFTRLLKGTFTVGQITFYYRILNQLQSTLSNSFTQLNDLMENSQKLKDIYFLYHTQPIFEDGNQEFPKLSEGPEVFFDNITFTYPQGIKPVIGNLSLKIKAGEKVAIVGHNGAGKTTLVRLILRQYLVNQGIIKINEQDIKDLKIASFYKNTGVLLQDYNTYSELTAKDNIYIGKADEPLDEVALHLAANSADASKFINEFPKKYEQILGENFKGGLRPSTGQWQKLAIARLFYRNPPLVIFDEPTSSIDAISEFNIFNRIYEFFKGKTVIIISHRFSTVRNADRIIVLNNGEITEEGSHDQLMARNGEYAKAFLLQAQGYQTTTIAPDLN